MPPSRRRSMGLLTGMRLGDMSAALEGRRLRRAEDRDDMEREQRRLSAANQALQSIIGGVGDYQDRQSAEKRQRAVDLRQKAMDSIAQEDRLEARQDRSTMRERRGTEWEQGQKDRARSEALARFTGLAPNRAGSLEKAASGRYEEDLGVPLPPEMGEERAIEDLLGGAKAEGGISDEEIEALLRGEMVDVKGGMAARQAAAAKAKRDEEFGALRDEKMRADISKSEAQAEAARRKGGRGSGAGAPKIDWGTAGDEQILAASKGGKSLDAASASSIGTYELAAKYADDTAEFYKNNIKGKMVSPGGRIVGNFNDAIAKAGLAEEWNELRRKNMITVQLLGRASEGGKLTDQDYDRYTEIFGDPSKATASEYERATENMQRLSRDLHNSALVSAARGGRDVSRFRLLQVPSQSQEAPQQPKPRGDVVMMRDPDDGEVKPIPRAKMEIAIQRGATIVLDETE